MSEIKAHEAEQVARKRGFYKDPDPRFKDLRGKFDDAARTNGEKEIKLAALYATLAKFALLDEAGDPIIELTRLIKEDDFGYTSRKAKRTTDARDENPIWGPKTNPNAGSTSFGINERDGGV